MFVQKVKSVEPTNRLFREVRERMTLPVSDLHSWKDGGICHPLLLRKIRRDPSLVWVKEQDREETHEFRLRQTEFKKHSTHQKEIQLCSWTYNSGPSLGWKLKFVSLLCIWWPWKAWTWVGSLRKRESGRRGAVLG